MNRQLLQIILIGLIVGLTVIAIRSIPIRTTQKSSQQFPPQSEISSPFKEYVAASKIDEALVKEIIAGRPIEVLVTFDETDIRSWVDQLRRRLALSEDTEEIRNQKVNLFRARKREVLSTLARGDYKVLDDYENAAVAYVRFTSSKAVLKVLRHPKVLHIRQNKPGQPL